MAITGTYSRTSRRTTRQNRPLEEVQAEHKRKKAVKIGKLPFRIKGIFVYLITAAGLILILGAINGYQKNMTVKDISIQINSVDDNHFLKVNDVKGMIGLGEDRKIIGETMESVELMALEEELQANPSIAHAEVFKSLGGALQIEVDVRKPVARIVNNDGTMLYVDADGNKFPTSMHHSAHVALIRGDFQEAIADTFTCSTIEATIPVLQFIQQDPFWNAQISEVVIRQSGELVLYPQIGDLSVEFGQPVRIVDKFENLRMFYHQVIKKIGWRKYKSVSVAYRGQVVAKKR